MRRVFWAHAARRLSKKSKRSVLETKAHCFDSDRLGTAEGSALCGLAYKPLARVPLEEVLAARNGADRPELCGLCRERDPGVYLNEESLNVKTKTKAKKPARRAKGEKFTVELNTRMIRGVRYWVGAVTVRLGPAPMDGVAVAAGKDRRVTTREHAPEWLVGHGLAKDEAEWLVAKGLGEPVGPDTIDWPDQALTETTAPSCKECDGQFWPGELARVVGPESMIHDECFEAWADRTMPRRVKGERCGEPSLPQFKRKDGVVTGPRCLLDKGHDGMHKTEDGMRFSVG